MGEDTEEHLDYVFPTVLLTFFKKITRAVPIERM
jgi:hypothetical protein